MTFSSFDLCILSLIDCFEFTARTFHPFDPLYPTTTETSKKRSFDHQVILNITPSFNEDEERKIVNLAEDTFFSNFSKKPLPLTAICQLKLNNALFIGAGTNFLRCAIKSIRRYFDYIFKVQNVWEETGENETQLIILESYSWHEITILLFSDSFNKMLQFILYLREMTMKEMKESISKDGKVVKALRKYKEETKYKADNELEKVRKLNESKERDECDWNQFTKSPKLITELAPEQPIETSPVFWNSTTTLGYRFEILKYGVDTKRVKPIKDDEIYGYCRWLTKGGGLGRALSVVGGQTNGAGEKVLICAGRGDFIYPRVGPRPPPFKDVAITKMNTKVFIETINSAHQKPNLEESVIAAHSVVAWEPSNELKRLEAISLSNPLTKPINQPTYIEKSVTNNLIVDVNRVKKEVYKPLRKLRMPKVVTERVLNTIALFNQGIKDQFLFSNFLELKPYIERLIGTIQHRSQEKGESELSQIANELNEIINVFEKGWRNRFQVGWKMSEITDYNLEFKGGIHQLVSVFDGTYKAVSAVIGAPDPIAVVSGDPRLFSQERSVGLNVFDIISPEFFVARMSHESALHRLQTSPSEDCPILSELRTASARVKAINIKELKRALPQYKDLLDKKTTSITPDIFPNVFADINTYYFTYLKKDIDLFNFWFRSLFISDPVSWKKDGKGFVIREDLLVDYLLRQFFVLKDDQNAFEIMKKYWSESELKVDEKFLQRCRDFVQKLYDSSSDIKNWYDAVKKYLEELYGRIYAGTDIDREIKEIKESLSQGKVYTYNLHTKEKRDKRDNEKDDFPFRFVQLVSYAYLSLLRDECLRDRSVERNLRLKYDYNILLKRDDVDGKPEINKDNDANILFDMRGGNFLWDPDVRKAYFKYRSAYLMSLWDMSAKEKFYFIRKMHLV